MKWPREVVGALHAPLKIGVDADGSLELAFASGHRRAFHAGEVLSVSS